MLHMIGLGVMFTFETVWMKRQGLDGLQIGVVLALATAVGFVCGLGGGQLADRLHRPRLLLSIGLLLAASAWATLSFCDSLGQFLGYALLRGLAWGLTVQLLPAVAMSVISDAGRGWGYASYRVFGSLGWITATLGLPWLIGDLQVLLRVAAAGPLLALAPLMLFRPGELEHKHFVPLAQVRHNRRLMGLLGAIGVFAFGMPAALQFPQMYADTLGAGDRFIGLLLAMNGLVALVALPTAGLLVDRVGSRAVLLVGLLAQPVRVGGFGLMTSYPWLLAPQPLHALTWAGVEIAGVTYATAVTRPGNRATAMALYFGVQAVGMFAGALAAGALADLVGYRWMFGIIAVGCLPAAGVLWVMCRPEREACTKTVA
jgi:MFS family permease